MDFLHVLAAVSVTPDMSGGCGEGDMMTQDEMNELMAQRFALEAAGEIDWQARAERAEAEIVVLMENDACLDALNLLWQDIILAKNPDYGDWEYPGQAYRHIKAEFDDAEARVAELEAGQGWRDPNDQPESGPVQIILNAQMVDFFFYVPDANGRMLFKDSIVAWRPAPPQ